LAGRRTRPLPLCHGRARPGHPRLTGLTQRKAWMAGTSLPLGRPKAGPEGPRPWHGDGRSRSVSAFAEEPGHDGKVRLMRLNQTAACCNTNGPDH